MNRGANPLMNISPVVKNLLIINAAVLLLGGILSQFSGIDLARIIGLYYFGSDSFRPFQIVTHMFMHAGFLHLLFNMYALWIFGQVLERVWGPKRFLIYYLVTGFGAAILHSLVNYFQAQSIMSTLSPEQINEVISKGYLALSDGMNYTNSAMGKLNLLVNIPTVGASGAVFGILLAFGMLFPNTELYMMFIPIPIKAKYFVMGYGALELFNGVANVPGDNIAHFAHLGGMLFGFILIKIWGKSSNNFY
jgi:membrane associated rhomboid family serine protease